MSAGLSGAGILVFAPISMAAGLTAAVVLFTILAVLLVLSTPAITVTGSTLRVGRATIERRFVGSASAFRGQEGDGGTRHPPERSGVPAHPRLEFDRWSASRSPIPRTAPRTG